jgi:hypothetical protein
MDDHPAMPSALLQRAQLLYKRFVQRLVTADFPVLGSKGNDVPTVSGGLATFPWDGRNVKELIESSELALGKAK